MVKRLLLLVSLVAGCIVPTARYGVARTVDHASLRKVAQPEASRTAIEEIGGIGGTFETVVVSGTLAYVGAGLSFTILNLRASGSPTQLSRYPNVDVRDIKLVGQRAYVAGGLDGFWIFDVSEPRSPVVLSRYRPANLKAEGVDIVGSRAYLSYQNMDSLNSEFRILDVSDPRQPTILGGLHTNGTGGQVKVAGGDAYIADGWGGLVIVTVRDASRPVVRARYDVNHVATSVDVAGDILALSLDAGLFSDQIGVHLLDVRDPAHPIRRAKIATEFHSEAIQLVDSQLHVVTSTLTIYDISNPRAPALRGSAALDSYGHDLHVVGNTAYVAAGRDGLRVIDVRRPEAPAVTGSYDVGDRVRDVEVVGTRAYVAGDNSSGGLTIFDVRNAARPSVLGVYDIGDTGRNVRALEVVEDLVYLATDNGLHILDVHDPQHPRQLGAYQPTSGVARDLDVADGYVYLVVSDSPSDRLLVIDVRNPRAPALRGVFEARFIAGVGVYAGIAYVLGGFWIVDVRNPRNPVLLGSDDTLVGEGEDVVVRDGLAYVADGFGLRIIDVSNPARPVLRSRIQPTRLAQGVSLELVDDFVYFKDFHGVHIVDVRDTRNPFVRASYNLDSAGNLHRFGAIDVVGDRIYVADEDAGLRILRVHSERFARFRIFLPKVQR